MTYNRLADEAAYFGAFADGVEIQQGKFAELRQQLAAALAACKQKDEALVRIEAWDSHPIAFAVDYGSSGVRDRYRQEAREALAIQPDDSALRAWIGEPVVWMQSDHLSKFVNHACGSQSGLVRCSDHQLMSDFKPLYAPKGMK